MILGIGSAWGAEEVYKTALFGSTYNSKGVTGYSGVSFNATNDGFTVTAANFNNNNNQWSVIKCGGKNGAYTGTITTNTPIDKAITKVAVTIDAITSSNVTLITLYTSTDNSSWTEAGTFDKSTGTKVVTLSSPTANLYYKIEFVCTQGTSNGLVTVSKVEYYYNVGGNPSCATPTFSPEAGTYTSAQNVEISTTTTGATIYYTTDGSDPTTSSSEYSSAISVSSNTTIKAVAVATGYDNSSVAEATYTIVSLSHAGTEADPYTVADARAAIDANTGVTGVYATGIVKEITTAYNSTYNNISFDIVDEAGSSTTLRAYRCTGSKAANVQEGDVVVVSGNLTKYNTTYEFSQGCELVSLTHPASTDPTITVDPATVNVTAEGGDGTISITYENITDLISFDFYYCDAQGNELQEDPDWISAEINVENNIYSLYYVVDANDGEARTAYIKVYTHDDDLNEVASIVSVTQAAYVAPVLDFATLPFAFDGGRADIENTDGLTQDGLETDYGSSPKLKFNGADDYVLLQFSERPGTLTFDIKGNSFSNSTFKVQTSEDGQTYTDLATYTDLTNTIQSESFNNLGENVRYIKWIYTEKASGNVALGNIALAKYKELQPYTLTVSGLENVYLYVFDAAAQNDPLIAEGGNGSAQVLEETQVMISPDPVEGYTLKSLLVDGVDHKDDLSSDGSYTFTMPNKDITITATVSEAIPVETKTYTLATSITSGKHYVIASGTEDEVKVMGAQNSNNRAAANGTVSGTTLSVASDAGATEFVIYGPDANGNYAIYDADKGYLYAASSGSNYLKSQDKINDNGKWSIDIDNEGVASIIAQGTNTRNVMQYNSGSALFSCYGSASQSPVYLYEKVGESAPTETVHVTSAKYATYCSENALDFSNTGLTAYIATLENTTVSFEEVTKVPAYTGVLLKANAAGDFTVNVATTVDDVTGNAFIGVTKETSEEAGIFVLMNGNSGVGFYKAENAFTVGAHTAYLPALPSASRNFIAIDEATAIKTIESKQQNGEIYNLAGQRVKSAQKGLYIIGGKKVVIK